MKQYVVSGVGAAEAVTKAGCKVFNGRGGKPASNSDDFVLVEVDDTELANLNRVVSAFKGVVVEENTNSYHTCGVQ